MPTSQLLAAKPQAFNRYAAWQANAEAAAKVAAAAGPGNQPITCQWKTGEVRLSVAGIAITLTAADAEILAADIVKCAMRAAR